MATRSEPNVKVFGLAREGGRFPGWGGVCYSVHPEFLYSWQAADCMNFTNRQGIQSYNAGVLSTRPGYSRDVTYQMGSAVDDNAYDYPTRMLAKYYPGGASISVDGVFSHTSKLVRLAQVTAGNNGSAFQVFNTTTGDFDNVTASGYTQGALSNGIYPQCMTWGLPTPLFAWAHPLNGFHTYDGTTDTKQPVLKNSNTAEQVTGFAWLDQLDGRAVGAGNFIDAGESGIVYYSAPNKPASMGDSANGGGSFPVYAADSRSGESPPKYIWGLATLHGSLIVFTEDMRYVVSGLGTASQSSRDYPGSGCFNGKCIVKYENKVYWVGKDGVFEWNGNEPLSIGEDVQRDFYSLTIADIPKFHSFVYKKQWWICCRCTAGTGTGQTATGCKNYVYDFRTKNWYVNDLPIGCAFSSETGLVETGYLYFAKATAVSNKYYHCIYGVDESDAHKAVYADDVRTETAVRVGTAISWYWITGMLDAGSPYMQKRFDFVVPRISTAISDSLATDGAFVTARLSYNLDDATAFTNYIDLSSTATTPWHALSFRGSAGTNVTEGHFIQLKLNGSGTKRLDIKRIAIEHVVMGVQSNKT